MNVWRMVRYTKHFTEQAAKHTHHPAAPKVAKEIPHVARSGFYTSFINGWRTKAAIVLGVSTAIGYSLWPKEDRTEQILIENPDANKEAAKAVCKELLRGEEISDSLTAADLFAGYFLARAKGYKPKDMVVRQVLLAAVQNKRVDVIQDLIRSKANFHERATLLHDALIYAIDENDLFFIKKIIDTSNREERKEALSLGSYYDEDKVLHYVAINANPETISYIFAVAKYAGLDVNVRDGYDSTPLHSYVELSKNKKDPQRTIEELIKGGCNPDLLDKGGRKALDVAQTYGKTAIIQALRPHTNYNEPKTHVDLIRLTGSGISR